MRKLGRLLVVALTLALLAAAGCGDDDDGGGGGGGEASGEPIKVGASLPLTGEFSEPGKAARQGYEVWEAMVNEKGGLIDGRPVEMIYKDDQSNQNTVVADYNALISRDRVDLLLGTFSSLLNLPASAVAERNRMLYVEPAGGAPELFDRGFRYLFFAQQATADHQGDLWAEWVTNLPEDKRPKTAAYPTLDDPFARPALEGIEAILSDAGIRTVYRETYTIDNPNLDAIATAIKATNADLVYYASYPPDSAGLIRATHEVGLGAKMLGGGMIGLQFAALKTQFGSMLNNIVCYDLYVPEPTMKFPGVEEFLVRYRERAGQAGVDPLGLYIPPFAYAEMQILEAAVKAVGSLDDAKLADHLKSNTFQTVVGDIKFGDRGEWAEPRILLIQYQGISGNDVEQFKQPGKQVILHPARFKSGELKVPFEPMKR